MTPPPSVGPTSPTSNAPHHRSSSSTRYRGRFPVSVGCFGSFQKILDKKKKKDDSQIFACRSGSVSYFRARALAGSLPPRPDRSSPPPKKKGR